MFFLPLLSNSFDVLTIYTVEYTLSGALEYLPRFTVDTVIFVIVLAFAIVFEKGVFIVRMAKKAV